MCRWIAYIGEPIFMDTIITKPPASLVNQSLNSRMSYRHDDGSLLATNGDGFGVGWYREREEPGLFKSSDPAWANENLIEICEQVRPHIFMAHIRAASTGSTQRSNAHPFKYGNWIFQHNGFVDKFEAIKRDLHNELSDELYNSIKGTTDSETLFKIATHYGLFENPKLALEKMINRLFELFKEKNIEARFALSCALSDGDKIYTIRYATIDKPNSQFYSTHEDCLKDISDGCEFIPQNSTVIVSEPLDHYNDRWKEMPHGSFATFSKNEKIEIEELNIQK